MIERVIRRLKERGASVAVAESCTGGRLAAALTEAAGSSEYFLGGVVAYSNEMKTAVLGVEREALATHGAVSRAVAEQMARGVLRLSGADFAVSTTGIAGPGGATPDKPVGTVWVGVASAHKGEGAEGRRAGGGNGEDSRRAGGGNGEDGRRAGGGNGESEGAEAVSARLFHFDGTRAENMENAVAAAMEMLGEAL